MEQNTNEQKDYSLFENIAKYLKEGVKDKAEGLQWELYKVIGDYRKEVEGLDKELEKAKAESFESKLEGKIKDILDKKPNLGSKIYEAANKYVREKIYGLTGDIGGNEEFKNEVNALVIGYLGMTKSQIEDMFRKEVKLADVENIKGKISEASGKKLMTIGSLKLDQIPDERLEDYKQFIIGYAKKNYNIKIKPEELTTKTKMNEYFQKLVLNPSSEELRKSMEKALRPDGKQETQGEEQDIGQEE
ncbi:hypothetical protein HZB88_05435 [archaeon]|nr:hypothetical protein [archaeon]